MAITILVGIFLVVNVDCKILLVQVEILHLVEVNFKILVVLVSVIVPMVDYDLEL